MAKENRRQGRSVNPERPVLAVELSEYTLRELRAFGKILDVVGGSESPKTDSELVEFFVSYALNQMLIEDIVHRQPDVKGDVWEMVMMFGLHPEYVCSYMAGMVEGFGKKELRDLKYRWGIGAWKPKVIKLSDELRRFMPEEDEE